jgi:hypothetical protein
MIKGTYIFYEDGKEICRSENVITRFGKRFLTNFIAGNTSFKNKDIALGIGSTAATELDTRLQFEFYKAPVSFGSIDIQWNEATSSYTYTVIYSAKIPASITGLIKEVGLYPSSDSNKTFYSDQVLNSFDDQTQWTNSGVSAGISTLYSRVGPTTIYWSTTGNTSKEYKYFMSPKDMSGYSVNDSLALSIYQLDNYLNKVRVKFYSSDTEYYYVDLTPSSSIGYDIPYSLLTNLFTNKVGSPNLSLINQIGIEIFPESGQDTTVHFDGLRINDEDTYDINYGIISRSILSSAITKIAGRSVDVEYRLQLSW